MQGSRKSTTLHLTKPTPWLSLNQQIQRIASNKNIEKSNIVTATDWEEFSRQKMRSMVLTNLFPLRGSNHTFKQKQSQLNSKIQFHNSQLTCFKYSPSTAAPLFNPPLLNQQTSCATNLLSQHHWYSLLAVARSPESASILPDASDIPELFYSV